jgi:hypothetical protein
MCWNVTSPYTQSNPNTSTLLTQYFDWLPTSIHCQKLCWKNSGTLLRFKCTILENNWTSKKKKKRLKSLHGAFQHLGCLGLLYSYPNKFPHSSPEAPRIIQMCETSTSEGGSYYQWILLANL